MEYQYSRNSLSKTNSLPLSTEEHDPFKTVHLLMITYEIQIHLLQNWKLSENTDSLFFIETCIIFSEVIIKDLKKPAGGQIIIINRARK